MKYKVHTLCFLLAYACPPTNVVFAEDSEKKSLSAPINEVEVGIIYNSEDSFKFGEYTGLQEEGFYLNGNFLVRSPSAYDDDSTEYYEAFGTNLGLDSRSLFGTYGELGKYSIHLDYDQLPRFQYDDAFSMFGGAGSSVQTLPAGWVPTANSPQILATTNASFPSSTQVDVETERKKFGGGLSWNPSEFWKFTADYHHEVKDGTGTLGATTATGGGGPASSSTPSPSCGSLGRRVSTRTDGRSSTPPPTRHTKESRYARARPAARNGTPWPTIRPGD